MVLGTGATQERDFVTAVVLVDDAGEDGDGGWIVLENFLAHSHPKGARAIAIRPGKAEAAGYRKRQASRSFQFVFSFHKVASPTQPRAFFTFMFYPIGLCVCLRPGAAE